MSIQETAEQGAVYAQRIMDLEANVESLRKALLVAQYEMTILVPRLSGPYRANVSAALTMIKRTLEEQP